MREDKKVSSLQAIADSGFASALEHNFVGLHSAGTASQTGQPGEASPRYKDQT